MEVFPAKKAITVLDPYSSRNICNTNYESGISYISGYNFMIDVVAMFLGSVAIYGRFSGNL